ncbi:VF530 family protein [uncultured Thiodictyon sp.]|uniref:VF530 family protein n=1 Tax=uncultured Thiodictyon sp. TaxID=1846217 RepID=UPI0025FE9B28|nr:VF530 family protein [uncultured Thiodictyon sp.]
MTAEQPKNPLHGVTLEAVLATLVDHYGWEGLADKIDINCFKNDPSVKSSLKFLRKTPWARAQVEGLYIATVTTPSTVWGRLPGASQGSSSA